jgi:hypothetical protein
VKTGRGEIMQICDFSDREEGLLILFTGLSIFLFLLIVVLSVMGVEL